MGLALSAFVAGCHRDQTRGLDAQPESPDTIEFGVWPVGGRKTMALKVGNSGAISLNFTEGLASEPFGVGELPTPVDPGSEGTLMVSFAPQLPGEATTDLVVGTSSLVVPQLHVKLHGIAYAPDFSADPGRLDFGDVNVGEFKTLDLTITNTSPVTLVPEIEMGSGKDYSVSPVGELGQVPARQQTRVAVTFAPTTAGDQPGSLLLSCSVCPTKQIELTGRGIAKPVPTTCTLTANPDRIDFGALDIGQTANRSVTLTSSGTGTCFISKPYFDPTSDPSFSGTYQPIELAPAQSTSLRVDFNPIATTPAQVGATLVLVSNDPANNPIRVILSGEVNPPPPPPPPPGKLEVTPASLTFTAQLTNTGVPPTLDPQDLTLRNSGGQQLVWTASADDAKIHLSKGGDVLAPAASGKLTVDVDPDTVAGTRTKTITIDAGAAGTVLVPVTITFTAAPPPPPPPAKLTVTPLTLSFSAEVGTAPAPQSITVGNSGGLALSYTINSDDPALTAAPSNGTLNGAASTFASVAVAMQTIVGTRVQHLVVDAGTAGQETVTVNIEFHQTKPPPPPPQYGDSVWPKFHHDNGNTGLSQIDTSGNKGVAKKVFLSLPAPARSLSGIWRNGTYQASPSLLADGTIVQVGGDGNLYAVDRNTLTVKWKQAVGEPMLASAESDITVVKSGHFFIHSHGAGGTTPQFFKMLDILPSGQTDHIIWKNTPGGVDSAGKRIDGFDSAPAIDYDGNLYLMNEDAAKVGSWDQTAQKNFDVDVPP
ncbi:MAG: choice-of-anchor D domain-containing protein [Deltaproteobacteria bacterium]|nr:choice-of-anchor D domain-containing protein [Deltaproteobacteria bacterium]